MEEILKQIKRIIAEDAHDPIVKETMNAVSNIRWYCRSEKKYVNRCVSYKCKCNAPKQ